MSQRSPVIFWLLLAAMLSVDAVALWMVSEPGPPYASVSYDALFVGQLSVVCIWSALRQSKRLWSRLAPLAMVVLGAAVVGLVGAPSRWMGLPYYGLHAALLVSLLWIFKRTAFWRRRSGDSSSWSYSLAHLLVAMTIVAVLAAVANNTQFFEDDGWITSFFIGSSVLLAMGGVIAWSLPAPWVLRLAGVLGLALLLGGAVSLMDQPLTRVFSIIIGTHFLIQALVISAWLGGTGILSAANPATVDDDGPRRRLAR